MKIHMLEGLPFVEATLTHQKRDLKLKRVLLDTGSAGTIFSTDLAETIGLIPDDNDFIHKIHGVGGSEFVFTKKVDQVSLDNYKLNNFTIELGEMDYKMDLDGILGIDFLFQMGAIINLSDLTIYPC